jgi:2,4-dienoyl-CoA reductase-like NADH-dependent reductase (Old Yellow Enzyme family)
MCGGALTRTEVLLFEFAWTGGNNCTACLLSTHNAPRGRHRNSARDRAVPYIPTSIGRSTHGAITVRVADAARRFINHRTDAYGGSFENRIRLFVEVTQAVRTVWPDELPLLARISGTDWVEGGWDIEQSVELARVLAPLGVDLIDCSSGGLVPSAKIPVAPGYQVAIAERVRREAMIPTAAVGLITGAAQAEAVVHSGKADMVFLARQLLRDPYWPLHAARELGASVTWPVQYERAVD